MIRNYILPLAFQLIQTKSAHMFNFFSFNHRFSLLWCRFLEGFGSSVPQICVILLFKPNDKYTFCCNVSIMRNLLLIRVSSYLYHS
jgi:hypothetical protein